MRAKINLYQLIEEAKTSKQQAQSKIVNIFWADVKHYILFMTKDDNSSEELTIETFTKVLNKLSLYNSDFDFRTWIISIAHNTTIDFLRKRSKNFNLNLDYESIEFKDSEPSPEDLFINKQKMESLNHMLDKLPENYKTVIQLRYMEGKKLKEIVEETNLSLANVKVSIMRAKKLLMEMNNKK